MSNNETGHSANVANLQKLNQIISSFGPTYNPGNSAISLSGLSAVYTTGTAKLNNVNSSFLNWKDLTNQREAEFKNIEKLSAQLFGLLQSSGASSETLKDFQSLVRKMRGQSKKKKTGNSVAPELSSAPIEQNPTPASISVSQQSFSSKLQHFEKMVILLQSIPAYQPNEPAFQIAALQSQLTSLQTANSNANNALVNLKMARNDRDQFLYTPQTGLLDLVTLSKAYVKGVYGSNSAEYKAVQAIKFSRKP